MRPRAGARAAVALLAGCFAACRVDGSPRLEIVAPDAQVGLEPGAVAEGRWTLRNTGDRDLLLHRLVPAFGCLPALPLPDGLAPGESFALTVRCRVPYAAGETVRELRLLSSDPTRPELPLDLALTVAGPTARPGALYFGYVRVGGSATREVELPESRTGRAAVAPPAPTDPALFLDPIPPRRDGRRAYRLTFRPHSAGTLHARVALGPGIAPLVVHGVAFNEVVAFPAEVEIPSVITGGTPPAISLLGVGPEPPGITRVEYPAGLAGELHRAPSGRDFRLTLRVQRGGVGSGDAAEHAIRVYGDAAQPLVVIPVVSPPQGGTG